MKKIIVLSIFCSMTLFALAEEQEIDSEVVIRQEDHQTIYEYRQNGRLYMIKIQPQIGPPYYLMDLDGDGEFENIGMDPFNPIMPQWTLFRW